MSGMVWVKYILNEPKVCVSRLTCGHRRERRVVHVCIAHHKKYNTKKNCSKFHTEHARFNSPSLTKFLKRLINIEFVTTRHSSVAVARARAVRCACDGANERRRRVCGTQANQLGRHKNYTNARVRAILNELVGCTRDW